MTSHKNLINTSMRQISDELLLEEVKALIESKKTPLNTEEVLNYAFWAQNFYLFESFNPVIGSLSEEYQKYLDRHKEVSEKWREVAILVKSIKELEEKLENLPLNRVKTSEL